jgi:hypothetical protein
LSEAERALLMQVVALLFRLYSTKPGKVPLSEMLSNLANLAATVEREAVANEVENCK